MEMELELESGVAVSRAGSDANAEVSRPCGAPIGSGVELPSDHHPASACVSCTTSGQRRRGQ